MTPYRFDTFMTLDSSRTSKIRRSGQRRGGAQAWARMGLTMARRRPGLCTEVSENTPPSGEEGCRLGCFCIGLIPWIIGSIVFPKVVHEHCHFSGHRHHRPAFGGFSAPGSNAHPVVAEMAVGSKGTEDILCGAHEETTQIGIARFGYGQGLIALTGLIPFW